VPVGPSSNDILGMDLSVEEKAAAINELILKDPRNAALYNDLGVLYAQGEQWLQARDAFIAAIQANPRDADMHRNLAMVSVHLEQYDMAEAEFRTYQRLAPDGGVDAYRLIAEALRRAGRADAAEAAFREGLTALSGSFDLPQARLVTGLARLFEEGDDVQSLETLLTDYAEPAKTMVRQAEAAGDAEGAAVGRGILDRLARVHVDNARLMNDSGLPAQAAELYEKAYALAPERSDLLPLIVDAWLAAGEVDKAKMAAGLATRAAPDAAGAWQAKGQIAEQEGRLQDALTAYEKASELAPEMTQLNARIGAIYLRLGQNEKARRHMSKVVSDPSTPPELLYNYALSLIRDDKHGLAVAPLRKVVERSPEMAPAWRALAGSLRQEGDYAEAARAYGQVMILDPDARVAFNQAYSLGRAGREEAAVAAYRKALELDPTYEKVHYNLGLALLGLERYEEARDELLAYLPTEPESPRVLQSIGTCHYHLGDYDDAVEFFERALEFEETPATWNNLGLAYEKLGEKSSAQGCFKKAREMRGGSR